MISVTFTCASEDEARKIASVLLDEKKAACVNIIPRITSLYIWKGKRCDDTECLAFVKTRKSLASKVMRRIKELHSYETPAILIHEVPHADADYLAWVLETTQKTKSKTVRSKSSRRRKNGRRIPGRRSRA